jgi:hypothetical protein
MDTSKMFEFPVKEFFKQPRSLLGAGAYENAGPEAAAMGLNHVRYKVQTLGQSIDVGEYQKVTQRVWRPRTGLIDMLVYDIALWEGQRFEVAAIVSPEGWKIRLQFLPRDASKLRAFLERVSIPFEEKGQVEGQFIHTEHFEYNEDLGRIKPVLQDIVGKIAKSQEREMS